MVCSLRMTWHSYLMSVLTKYHCRMAWPDQDEGLIARLKVACWRETYPGMLPQPILDGLDVGRSTREWARGLSHGIAWIAEQCGEGVGFGHVREDEITTLYVRKADQCHGVGAALLGHCFDEVSCMGHRTAHLWVLEENAVARRFYEYMGGNFNGRRSVGFARWPNIKEVRYDFRLDF